MPVAKYDMRERSGLFYCRATSVFLWGLTLLITLLWYFLMVLLVWDLDGYHGERAEWFAPFAVPIVCYELFVLLRHHWKARGAILRVMPEGLHDLRVTAEPVPWEAIESLALQRNVIRMDILVRLKEGYTRGQFGKPKGVPRIIRELVLPKSEFSISGGLERNLAGVSNDINGYAHKPDRIWVSKA